MPFEIPVTPGPDEAREWAERELADPVYDAAQPTFIDRIAQAIGDFLTQLLSGPVGGGWSPLLGLIVLLVIAGLVVGGLLIWGRPRLAHRVAGGSSLLFGDDETRSAAQLRASAAAHAEAGRWDQAVAERYRALARGLEERDVLDALPGTTARALATRAAEYFPGQAAGLQAGAAAFDDVRYLRRRGTAEMYAAVAATDDEIARTRPSHLPDALAPEGVGA